jgi:nicotinamidase-related amidase
MNIVEKRMDHPHALLDRAKSCLVVIDVQQYFLDKLPLDQRGPLVERIAWLMRVARYLEIPIISTAEDPTKDGPLLPLVSAELPPGSKTFDKMTFGLFGQPDIRRAIEDTRRREFVLVGLETDVCIAHSALGLLEAGYRVTVLEDATASPPPHHDRGLQRMAAAGVMMSSVKGVYYEWVRDLKTNAEVKSRLNPPLPPGLTL